MQTLIHPKASGQNGLNMITLKTNKNTDIATFLDALYEFHKLGLSIAEWNKNVEEEHQVKLTHKQKEKHDSKNR